MGQLQDIADSNRDGFSLGQLLRGDRDYVGCWTCHKLHPLRSGCEQHDYDDFAIRHPVQMGCVVMRLGPNQLRRIVNRAIQRRKRRHDSILRFTSNASVLSAFQASDQSLDLTSLNSLASSATAGWSSQWIDNSTNLYLDYLAAITFAAVNTAPASDKSFYIYGATSLNTTDRPNTGAASGGVVANSSTTAAALTFPSVSTLPSVLGGPIYTLNYPVQNAPLQTPLFNLNGRIGLFIWYGLVNFSGMAIAASSNAFKYRGLYSTVA